MSVAVLERRRFGVINALEEEIGDKSVQKWWRLIFISFVWFANELALLIDYGLIEEL